MSQNKIVDILLWILLAVGVVGAARVSWANYNGEVCPQIWIIPVCYVVLTGYVLMVAATLIPIHACRHIFFCIGWGAVFVIALLGSALEFFSAGGVCPSSSGGSLRGASSGGIPMCYLSLALALVILVLFLIGPYKRSCDICNAKLANQ